MKETAFSFFFFVSMLLASLFSYGCGGASENEQDSGADAAADADSDSDRDGGEGGDAGADGSPDAGIDGNWIAIPGGSFLMGSDEGMPEETPVHTVNVPTFQMWRTEVTVEQYGECVEAAACSEPGSGGIRDNWGEPGFEQHPVNSVDWFQAREFCEWAGGRLPSESEWEYAARSAGLDIIYPWGDDEATCDYAVMDDEPHLEGCDLLRTWPVCSKPDGNTKQGLCDMAGNVWEWIEDLYDSDYEHTPTDGSANEPRSPNPDYFYDRVVRGGSFELHAFSVRTTHRCFDDENSFYYFRGFRCARDII